jgi:purine catabolism regulator
LNLDRLFQWKLPEGTLLLGGAAGLGREVSWVVRLRQSAPAFGRLRGGELALVPLDALRRLQPPVTLGELLTRLAEVGVAGVAIQGAPPDGIGAIADRLPIPLLQLADGVALTSLEQQLNRQLAEWQGELRNQSEHVYRELMELALARRGQLAIAERLSRILAKPVSFEDPGGDSVGYAASNGAPPSRAALPGLLASTRAPVLAWAEQIALNAADPPVRRVDLPQESLSRLVAPVVSQDRVAGWLSVWAPPADLGALEHLALARGAAACAVEVGWGHAVAQARDQLQGDLSHDLLVGGYGDDRQALERAARMGFDLETDQVVLAAASPDTPAEQLARQVGKRALLSPEEDALALIVPAPAEGAAALKALAAQWARELARPGEDLRIGIGRVHAGLEGIARGWREALESLTIGRALATESRVTFFGELGLYRFLFAAHDPDELRAFYEEVLGALAEYDQRHNSELIPTLDAYFRSRQSPTAAAGRLHAHRNTVLYRLQRIEAISGLRLDDAEDCLALHLALRVREVIEARAG